MFFLLLLMDFGAFFHFLVGGLSMPPFVGLGGFGQYRGYAWLTLDLLVVYLASWVILLVFSVLVVSFLFLRCGEYNPAASCIRDDTG